MENSGLISVIIPVYNVEEYLRECVDSVLSQTYKNCEIILVDDGSTDSSGKICDEYAEANDKITVDTKLLNLNKNRSQVAFVEALRFKDESKPQIIGSIDPKLFYCPKCGQIKFLENDNDIVNMRCTNDSCVAKGKQSCTDVALYGRTRI